MSRKFLWGKDLQARMGRRVLARTCLLESLQVMCRYLRLEWVKGMVVEQVIGREMARDRDDIWMSSEIANPTPTANPRQRDSTEKAATTSTTMGSPPREEALTSIRTLSLRTHSMLTPRPTLTTHMQRGAIVMNHRDMMTTINSSTSSSIQDMNRQDLISLDMTRLDKTKTTNNNSRLCPTLRQETSHHKGQALSRSSIKVANHR
jgi:hypothetical protein